MVFCSLLTTKFRIALQVKERAAAEGQSFPADENLLFLSAASCCFLLPHCPFWRGDVLFPCGELCCYFSVYFPCVDVLADFRCFNRGIRLPTLCAMFRCAGGREKMVVLLWPRSMIFPWEGRECACFSFNFIYSLSFYLPNPPSALLRLLVVEFIFF